MTPDKFVADYYMFAQQAEHKTGIPAIAIMAQAALESGWGKHTQGFNFFGIKAKKGEPFVKMVTTEYNTDRNYFDKKDVVSVEYIKSVNKYRFRVYQKFAKYQTPEHSFLAHSELLLKKRYKEAQRWLHSPKRFLIAIWRAGYATDPKYGCKMIDMVHSIKKRI